MSENIIIQPNKPQMKTCIICGREHPEDLSTSHHPNGCTCGSLTLHAPDGKNEGPGGCIWMRVLKIPPNAPPTFAMEKYLNLILERSKDA